MATRVPTIDNSLGDSVLKVQWAGLLNGDVGSPIKFPEHIVRSVQLAGTLGAGGSVNIEGSNDGANFGVLGNQQAAALTLTALGMKVVADVPQLTRPNVTAGDGTTSLTVTMMLERPARSALN